MRKMTDVSFREYMDNRFEAAEKAVGAALAAAKEAVSKAETAVEKRFDNTNEWRNTVESLQRTYMPRNEFDQVKHTLSDKIDLLTKRIDERDSVKRGGSDAWALFIAVISLLGTGISFFFRAH